MNNKYTFSIVTPVKDEIRFFPKTADSVLAQKYYPREWIIINDGSTDGTTEYIKELELKYSWIRAVHLPADRIRKPGGEFVIQKAMDMVGLEGLDYLIRMDGDVQFDENFLNVLFQRMADDPKIGIAGGVLYAPSKNGLVEERTPKFHVRGSIKTYKIECLNQIGGFGTDLGWDTIDEVKANLYGWKTISYPDIKVIHLKPTRGSANWYKARLIDANSAYKAGYHPAFLISRAVRYLFRPPAVIGSLTIIMAFFQNYLKRVPRQVDQDYLKFIRKNQINKLLGKETIWK